MSPPIGVIIEIPPSDTTNTTFNNTTSTFPNIFIGKIMKVESENNKIILDNSKITGLQNGTTDTDAVNYSQIKNDNSNIENIINHINEKIHPILNEILIYLNNLNSSLGNLALSNYDNIEYVNNNPVTEPFNIPIENNNILIPLTYNTTINNIQIIE